MSFPSNPPSAKAASPIRPRRAALSANGAEQTRVFQRQVEDTSVGCRERAAASLIAAAAMDTESGQLRLQPSAVSWMARAELIASLEERQKAREGSLLDGAERASRHAGEH